MSNCEICDQELVEGEFEDKLGICVNCIMIDCRDYSYKSFFLLIMVILGGIMFITAFIPMLFIIHSLFIDFEGYFSSFFTMMIISAISGFGLIYFSVVFKFKQFQDYNTRQ